MKSIFIIFDFLKLIMKNTVATKTWNFRVASIFVGLSVGVSIIYWSGMLHEMLHEKPNYNLMLAICTFMCCLAGIFYTTNQKWWVAIFPGAISGAGSFVVFDWYADFFQRHNIIMLEAILVCTIGALPGLLLYRLILKIITPKTVK